MPQSGGHPIDILFCDEQVEDSWQAAFDGLKAPVRLIPWPNWASAPMAEYALVWKPPAGQLAQYRNLKLIFSLGAGVDHLKTDVKFPKHVPVVRMMDEQLVKGMVEYVLLCVLMVHRKFPEYMKNQKNQAWMQIPQMRTEDRRIGILGMGSLGSSCARHMAMHGFNVRGWSRTEKSIQGVVCYAGSAQLHPFLSETEMLINLLPLTDETVGILNAELFRCLPDGASIVNAGRGDHVDEVALIEALDAGKLRFAFLDTFSIEPLPRSHPFWLHEKIFVTPHAASITPPASGAAYVWQQLSDNRNGNPPANIVDWARGY